jgi:hypothetical protein
MIGVFFKFGVEECIVDSSCKKPFVICNSIFFIFLNQIKAQRNQKIIVWVEYFPYKYSLKVLISNDYCHKSAVANAKWFLQLEATLFSDFRITDHGSAV